MHKLHKYIKHNGISQKRLAEKIGCTPNNLSMLLHGKTAPSIRMAYAIEVATGGLVTMYDWIDDEIKEVNGYPLMQKEVCKEF